MVKREGVSPERPAELPSVPAPPPPPRGCACKDKRIAELLAELAELRKDRERPEASAEEAKPAACEQPKRCQRCGSELCKTKWPNVLCCVECALDKGASSERPAKQPVECAHTKALRILFDSCSTTHPDWGADICEPDGNAMSQASAALASPCQPAPCPTCAELGKQIAAAEEAINGTMAAAGWKPSTPEHHASRVNLLCHNYTESVRTLGLICDQRDSLRAELATERKRSADLLRECKERKHHKGRL